MIDINKFSILFIDFVSRLHHCKVMATGIHQNISYKHKDSSQERGCANNIPFPSYVIFSYVYVCESFCEYAHMRLGSCIEYKRVLNLLELVL